MKPELMKQLRLSWLLTGIVMLSISCKKEYSLEDAAKPAKDYNFTILFKPVVDTVSLKFDSSYLNRYNEQYKVSAFKFYVSNIALVNTDSNISYKLKKEEYYLVDFSDSVSTVLKLKAVPFKYNRISLTIGVDSIHNVSGAQTGAHQSFVTFCYTRLKCRTTSLSVTETGLSLTRIQVTATPRGCKQR